MPEIKLVYQQIKEYIEQEAKSKKPGEALGSEVQYSQLFNVSRPTVRKSVDELVAIGLVKRLPGKGLIAANPEDAKKEETILIAIPYIPADGFFFNMITGCIDKANAYGFKYKIINQLSSPDRLKAFMELDLSSYYATILTAYEDTCDEEILKILKSAKHPFIVVDNPISGHDCPFVVTDDYTGGYLAGDYLIHKGHRDIIYISLTSKTQTVLQREKGFRKALTDNKIDISEENIIHINKDEDIIDVLASIDTDFTAICGYSDIPVIMAFNYLAEHGIKVPEQVSLLGYGNFVYSELLSVPLTTISMPVYEMGSKAVDMALDILNGKSTGERIVLDVTLMERNSVAAI
jgi:Transcriptional regulators